MSEQTFSITSEKHGMRLDLFVAEMLGISRMKAQKMIENEGVLINGAVSTKASQRLLEGAVVSFQPVKETPKPQAVVQEEKNLLSEVVIVKETDDFLVVNKPSGMLTHPTEAGEPYTLADWIRGHVANIDGVGENPVRPGIVHRLDREASGLLVIAKTQAMFEHLKSQFKARSVQKEYRVLVHGVIDTDMGTIDFVIDRGTDGKMVSRPKVDELSLRHVNKIPTGKKARTDFWVEQRYINYSLLRVRIHTGRTHQIRVHMLAYAHPVVGDTLYENKKRRKFNKGLDRLFLHACRLGFEDLNGNMVEAQIELPEVLKNFLEQIT